MPLDRSGVVPGTVNLAVARVPAARQPSRGTILFLAGGPGESALSGGENLVGLFRRYAPDYDLLTFDQRGTGRSGGLTLQGARPAAAARPACSAAAAPSWVRGARFYRTSDSVDDIEAVRRRAGGGPISILGVSYGGRVAAEYVRRYPAAVTRMVLDSPSTLQGTDPFFRQRQVALPRVLRSICGRACRSFTRSPIGDMSRVARRLADRPLRTYVVTPRGRRTKVRFTLTDLYGLVSLSDLDAVTRARLPGAVAAARRGDGAPLARVLTGTVAALGGPAQQRDRSATRCSRPRPAPRRPCRGAPARRPAAPATRP